MRRLTDIRCPKAVIARVNGWSIGGGNHLAYFCDITIAAEHARFGQNGPRVASPAGGYMVAHLANIVGHKRAREMWMLCRRYTASEALDMGLVNRVVPLDRLEAEVDAWCAELFLASPGCLEVLKAAFDQEMDGYEELGVISSRLYPDWFDTPEGKEGGNAFVEKRKPRFYELREREAAARQRLADEYEKKK
jgi:naphthoate synthase/2-ketocyclohexanecarboxyl-CoA hydrolase